MMEEDEREFMDKFMDRVHALADELSNYALDHGYDVGELGVAGKVIADSVMKYVVFKAIFGEQADAMIDAMRDGIISSDIEKMMDEAEELLKDDKGGAR